MLNKRDGRMKQKKQEPLLAKKNKNSSNWRKRNKELKKNISNRRSSTVSKLWSGLNNTGF